MKQDEARKTKHHHTPSNQGKANGPSHEATRYPEGGTSTETGPGRRKGPTEGGEGNNSQRGREPPHSPTKTAKTRKPQQHQKVAHKGQREDNRKINRQKRQQYKDDNTEEPQQREEPKRPKQRPNRGQGKHGPKQAKPGVQEGGQDHKNASKKTPTTPAASGSKLTKQCQGTIGTEAPNRCKKGHAKSRKERRRKGEGGRYVILRVVYSR